MKKKSGNPRTVRVMSDDVMIVAYCEECGSAITNEDKAYVDHDGKYFDCLDCLFEYYDICEVEF